MKTISLKDFEDCSKIILVKMSQTGHSDYQMVKSGTDHFAQSPNIPHYYLRTNIQVVKLYKSLQELPTVRLNEHGLKEIDYRSRDILGDSSTEKAFYTTAHPVFWNGTRKFLSVN